MKFVKLVVFALLWQWTLLAHAATASLPPGVEFTTAAEGISEYRLKNGLRVLLFPDESKQTITVNVTYLVGSAHENYGETGMAHLLEHLMFKGTPRHRDIPRELTEHGARPNGTTWYDRTNYFETFAATEDNLKWALDLEADRMVNSFIAVKDLESEMTVVRNEYESGENRPATVLMQRMASTAYLWHNYGNATIGARADIENVPIERLRAFYKTYYQPDNAVLLVAGKIDAAATLKLIQQYFGKIPRPKRALPASYTTEPTQDGERTVTLRRSGDVQLAALAYHVPAGSHEDFAAVEILSQVLGDTPSGRLHKALVETGKAANVYSFEFQLRAPGLALFGAEVRQDASLDAARDALIATVEGLPQQPVTQAELERARTQLLKQIDLSLNASDRVGLALSEWLGMGDWRLFFLHRDRLRAVTLADVQGVATQYYKPSNRTVGLFVPTAAPDRAEIPPIPDIAAALRDYKGDAPKAAGEVFDPSPANIEARTLRFVTPGGLKVALVPKRTRGNAVVGSMTLRFGNEQNLLGRRSAGNWVPDMLMRGTQQRTREALMDEIDRLQARLNVGGGATAAGVFLESTRVNLPELLRLVAEVLRQPAFTAGEFELLRQEALAAIEEQQKEPNALAAIDFQRHLNPYAQDDVRYIPTLAERIADAKALTLDEVKRFYAEFYGAQHGEITLVGDFDPQEITPLLNQLFQGWDSALPYTRVPNPYQNVAALDLSLPTPDKANAVFIAGMNLAIRDDDPDYPALVLGNYMLGGGFLSSRLATRVRQQEGLSYSIGSQLSANALDRNGLFRVSAIYAPQNLPRLEAAISAEITRALNEGFTAAELQAAKSGWLQAQQVGRAQDPELARRLSAYSFLGRTLAWDADFEGKIKSLTPEQIKAAMQRHIDPAKLSKVKAGDFKNGPQ